MKASTQEADGDIHTNETSTSSLTGHRMINILIREFAPKQTVADQNALEQFQKQWSTYQKLVDADALSHASTRRDPRRRDGNEAVGSPAVTHK